MLRFLTAGESHGPGLTVIIEGLPAGFQLSVADINEELARRQQGHGRGLRMEIEKDKAQVSAGLRAGVTIGSPVAITIENRDFCNWAAAMHPTESITEERPIEAPRPGHADLAGGFKYGSELRNIAERASARETAARVAVGAVAKQMLMDLGVMVESQVTGIGDIEQEPPLVWDKERIEASPVRCPDERVSHLMQQLIDESKRSGDSVGGAFVVRINGLPPGVGSVMHWDRRLDGLLAQAIISIPGIKACELGEGIKQSRLPGSLAQDQLHWDHGPKRLTNLAGGLEGGMTNGSPLLLKAYMKPIPSIPKQLQSFNWLDRTPQSASRERADVCAVPAASIVGEAMLAIVVLNALLQQLGGDRWPQVKERFLRLNH